MADDNQSFLDKFKAAFEEDPPKAYRPVPGLDPDKAKAMSKVFGGGDDSQQASGPMQRRLDRLKSGGY